MSNALATAIPARRPAQAPARHIEIVPTRDQRRARPRAVYALTAVIGVFALFGVQLLLSIVLSDGAYQISSLQGQQRQLTREAQALNEDLDLLASPQNLASQAETLGMVVGTSAPTFLRLSDGSVTGQPSAAAAGTAGALGSDGGLVPNSLLDDQAALAAGAAAATATDTTTSAPAGASSPPSSGGNVASNGGTLPSPQTR